MTRFERRPGPCAGAAVSRREAFHGWFSWHAGLFGAVAAACLAAASASVAASGDEASAALVDAEGKPVGTVELSQKATGTAMVAKLENLPEGIHAFHLHETGACEPPFESAGGHYNPTDVSHGFDSENGPHLGDLPNIYVPASGALTFEVFDARLALSAELLDDDGAAIVIHAGADDYKTDPAGDAGDRIACGVVKGGPAG